jgi:hypothetical protein
MTLARPAVVGLEESVEWVVAWVVVSMEAVGVEAVGVEEAVEQKHCD